MRRGEAGTLRAPEEVLVRTVWLLHFLDFRLTGTWRGPLPSDVAIAGRRRVVGWSALRRVDFWSRTLVCIMAHFLTVVARDRGGVAGLSGVAHALNKRVELFDGHAVKLRSGWSAGNDRHSRSPLSVLKERAVKVVGLHANGAIGDGVGASQHGGLGCGAEEAKLVRVMQDTRVESHHGHDKELDCSFGQFGHKVDQEMVIKSVGDLQLVCCFHPHGGEVANVVSWKMGEFDRLKGGFEAFVVQEGFAPNLQHKKHPDLRSESIRSQLVQNDVGKVGIQGRKQPVLEEAEVGQLVRVHGVGDQTRTPILDDHLESNLGVMGDDVAEVRRIIGRRHVGDSIASGGFKVGHDAPFKVGQGVIALERRSSDVGLGELSPDLQRIRGVAGTDAGWCPGLDVERGVLIDVGRLSSGPRVTMMHAPELGRDDRDGGHVADVDVDLIEIVRMQRTGATS